VDGLKAEINIAEERYKALYEQFLKVGQQKEAEIERLKEEKQILKAELSKAAGVINENRTEIEQLKMANSALESSSKSLVGMNQDAQTEIERLKKHPPQGEKG
jgi:FtsZ-binding cell division protein ZapB